jgi:hypothetical protein
MESGYKYFQEAGATRKIVLKIILKNILQKFGTIKKIDSSLHSQIKIMQRILSHIETANRFSPKGDYVMAGQVLLHG